MEGLAETIENVGLAQVRVRSNAHPEALLVLLAIIPAFLSP